jgi:hypothetical protein
MAVVVGVGRRATGVAELHLQGCIHCRTGKDGGQQQQNANGCKSHD